MTGFVFLQLRSRLSAFEGLTVDQLDLLERVRSDVCALFGIENGQIPAMVFRIGNALPPSGRTLRRVPSDVMISPMPGK